MLYIIKKKRSSESTSYTTRLRSSFKFSFHHSTISRAEVSSPPPLLRRAWERHCMFSLNYLEKEQFHPLSISWNPETVLSQAHSPPTRWHYTFWEPAASQSVHQGLCSQCTRTQHFPGWAILPQDCGSVLTEAGDWTTDYCKLTHQAWCRREFLIHKGL